MTWQVILKIVFLCVITVLAIVCVFADKFFPEKNYKGREQQRVRIVVRLKMICFIVMLVLLLLIILIK